MLLAYWKSFSNQQRRSNQVLHIHFNQIFSLQAVHVFCGRLRRLRTPLVRFCIFMYTRRMLSNRAMGSRPQEILMHSSQIFRTPVQSKSVKKTFRSAVHFVEYLSLSSAMADYQNWVSSSTLKCKCLVTRRIKIQDPFIYLEISFPSASKPMRTHTSKGKLEIFRISLWSSLTEIKLQKNFQFSHESTWPYESPNLLCFHVWRWESYVI